MYVTTEKRLRRTIWMQRMAMLLLLLTAGIFIGLFLNSLGDDRSEYKKVFDKSLENALVFLEQYDQETIDQDKIYRSVIGESNTIQTMGTFLGLTDDQEICLIEIYHALLTYPEQMKAQLPALREGYEMLKKDYRNQEAYVGLHEVLNSLDKLGD